MPEVKIEPKETALLVIDMQNDVLHEKGKLAALGVWKFAKDAGTIQNTRKMIDIANKNSIPILYVKAALSSEDYVDMELSQAPLVKLIREGEVFKEDSWGAEYVDELKPETGDYIIVKRRIDAFYNTELETLLRSLGRKTLIVCGVVTNLCVEGTVRGAVDRVLMSSC